MKWGCVLWSIKHAAFDPPMKKSTVDPRYDILVHVSDLKLTTAHWEKLSVMHEIFTSPQKGSQVHTISPLPKSLARAVWYDTLEWRPTSEPRSCVASLLDQQQRSMHIRLSAYSLRLLFIIWHTQQYIPQSTREVSHYPFSENYVKMLWSEKLSQIRGMWTVRESKIWGQGILYV